MGNAFLCECKARQKFGAELVGARFDQRIVPADPRDLSRGPRREPRGVPLSRTPKIGRPTGSWAGVWKNEYMTRKRDDLDDLDGK